MSTTARVIPDDTPLALSASLASLKRRYFNRGINYNGRIGANIAPSSPKIFPSFPPSFPPVRNTSTKESNKGDFLKRCNERDRQLGWLGYFEEWSRDGRCFRFEGSEGRTSIEDERSPFPENSFQTLSTNPFRAFVTFLLPCTPTAPHRTSVSRNGTISCPFPLPPSRRRRQRVRSGKRRRRGREGKKSGEKMGERIERLLPPLVDAVQ